MTRGIDKQDVMEIKMEMLQTIDKENYEEFLLIQRELIYSA